MRHDGEFHSTIPPHVELKQIEFEADITRKSSVLNKSYWI